MRILGIESTAHTLGIGIVDERDLLADQRSMYTPKTGGIRPGDAADHHAACFSELLRMALEDASLALTELEGIAFAQGPGMHACLNVGAIMARYLSLQYDFPLYGVNHAVAHLEIGKRLCGAENPDFLYVSGGNSQVITKKDGRYFVIGETQDIALGNALDKFARTLGIPHPGGAEIEKLAEKGRTYVEVPYVVKGMDFSFTGLVSATERLLSTWSKEDLCYSFQETAFAMVTEACERMLALTGRTELLLTGGVAANRRLCGMLDSMCSERDVAFFACPLKYSGDNGTMIAHLGLLCAEKGEKTRIEDSGIRSNWRVSDVVV